MQQKANNFNIPLNEPTTFTLLKTFSKKHVSYALTGTVNTRACSFRVKTSNSSSGNMSSNCIDIYFFFWVFLIYFLLTWVRLCYQSFGHAAAVNSHCFSQNGVFSVFQLTLIIAYFEPHIAYKSRINISHLVCVWYLPICRWTFPRRSEHIAKSARSTCRTTFPSTNRGRPLQLPKVYLKIYDSCLILFKKVSFYGYCFFGNYFISNFWNMWQFLYKISCRKASLRHETGRVWWTDKARVSQKGVLLFLSFPY